MIAHRGWHSRGYLPHYDQPGLLQSLNFRLADSIPKSLLLARQDQLQSVNNDKKRQQIEEMLDRGAGSCLLRQPACAKVLEDALLHDDGFRYHLLAWCIMPNHVHALLQVLEGHPLDKVVQAIKSVTAHRINKLLNRSGPLWRAEYFDRFIRDAEHFAREVDYIEFNPVKAGLCRRPEEWPFSSAGWRLSGTPPYIPG